MSNLDTLNDFVKTMNDRAGPNYHSVDHLMTLFCADDGDIPFVGITLRGPQFKGKAAIKKLFNQLLKILIRGDGLDARERAARSTARHDRQVDVSATRAGMVHRFPSNRRLFLISTRRRSTAWARTRRR